jgi:hypothetical protein
VPLAGDRSVVVSRDLSGAPADETPSRGLDGTGIGENGSLKEGTRHEHDAPRAT